jgi:hypothetical protein
MKPQMKPMVSTCRRHRWSRARTLLIGSSAKAFNLFPELAELFLRASSHFPQ